MKLVALRRSHYWFLSLLCVASLVASQAGADLANTTLAADTRKAVFMNDTPLLPNLQTLDLLSLNNQPLLADLIWLNTIQYFGGGSPYGDFPALGQQIDEITQLDPKFEYPYEFGLVALPFMGQAKTAERIGLRAQDNIPNNGLLTFYLASAYQLNLKEYKKAGDYYTLASKQPGSPAAAELLAAISYNNVTGSLSDRQVAIAFWETVIANAKTDEEAERATNWWKQMQIVYSLEITAQQFKTKEGRFPASLDELVSKGYLTSVPASPVERVFEIDPATGIVSFDKVAS